MGLTATTTNLSYARNELIKVGQSFIFDKVADMIYYMLANDDVSTASTAAQTIAITDEDGGGYGLKITNTFTKVGAIAHKALWSDVTYTPASTGTACPIAVAGKVNLNGNLTYANSYPGYGWGVQGQLHIVAGTTLAGGTADPGSIYAGVRGTVTSAGTSTYTSGQIACFYGDMKIGQENAGDGANIRIYGMWLLGSGSGNLPQITAGLKISTGGTGADWNDKITTGIDINDSITGIDIDDATTGIVIGSGVTTGISVDSATDSGSTVTGSIHTDGGLGVAKKLYVGTELFLVAGPIDMTTAASDIEIKANTVAALEIKGAANLLAFDTRNTVTGVTAFTFTVPDIGFASGTGSTRLGVTIDPGTLTFTGTATVTAMEGLGLYLSAHTFAGTAATVTTASTVYIASAPASGGSVTVANGYALKIASGNMLTAGRIIVDDTTASTSTITGSIQTDGGLGVAGDMFLGGFLNVQASAAETLLDFVLETEWQGGTLINADFGDTTTQNADIIGMELDFNDNLAGVTNLDVTGWKLLLPALTQSAANTTTYIGFDLATAGACVNSGTAIVWKGVNLQLPAITETSGSVVGTGLYITGATISTPGTLNGILLTGTMTTGIDMSGATLANDIVLQEGATITNSAETVLTITEGTINLVGAVTVGASESGKDVTFYGETTAGVSMLWDADENGLYFAGTPGTANPMVSVGTSGAPIVYAADSDVNVSVYSSYTKVDGFYRGLYSISTYNPAGDTGAASVYGIRGLTVLASGVTFSGGGYEMLTGTHGLVTLSGTVNDATVEIDGVRGEVNGSPTAITTSRFIGAVTAKCGLNTAVTAGKYAAFLGYSHVTTAGKWPDAMAYFWGYYEDGIDFSGWAGNPTTGYAFVFQGGANRGTTAGAFSNDTVAGTTQDGYIRIKVGATAAKVPYWFDD